MLDPFYGRMLSLIISIKNSMGKKNENRYIFVIKSGSKEPRTTKDFLSILSNSATISPISIWESQSGIYKPPPFYLPVPEEYVEKWKNSDKGNIVFKVIIIEIMDFGSGSGPIDMRLSYYQHLP